MPEKATIERARRDKRHGKVSAETRRSAARDAAVGRRAKPKRPSRSRSQAAMQALKDEPRAAASHRALSRQARSAAKRRTKSDR